MSPDIETVFLMASDKHQFISARLVKEIARLGGDITQFVSSRVANHVCRRLTEG
jgi:pantetheine-phosphate adenylyltransferase